MKKKHIKFISIIIILILVVSSFASLWVNTGDNSLSNTEDELATTEEKLEMLKLEALGKIEAKEYNLALNLINEALQLSKPDSELYLIRGQVYELQGKEANALADYYRVLNSEPDNEELIKKCLQINVNLKDYTSAIEDISKLIELYPDEADYYISLASYQTNLELYEDAIKNYKIALELYPDKSNNFFIFSALGSCYFQLEDYDNTISYFNKYFQVIDDKDITIEERSLALLQRGISYFNSGNFPEAARDLSEYQDLYPDESDYWFYLASAYYINEDHDSATLWLQKCISSNIQVTEASYYLADIYIRDEKFEEAMLYYTTCIKEDFSKDICYYNRGFCHINLDNIDSAKSDFEAVLRITSDNDLRLQAEDVLKQLEDLELYKS